tara:strand:+ start:571 stop:4860 length:4290 start_codon:yes stop_codon:yes gene_type:complete
MSSQTLTSSNGTINIYANPQASADIASNVVAVAALQTDLTTVNTDLGAKELRIESALGEGTTPRNTPIELFGCYPLFYGAPDARRFKEAGDSKYIPVDNKDFQRPVGAAFWKGHHDSVKAPLEVSLAPSTAAAAESENPVDYPLMSFDNMFALNDAGEVVQTQVKTLVEIPEMMQEKWDVFEGSCDKGEWVEPGVLGYRVHVTKNNIFYNKYSHPTDRSTQYLVEENTFNPANGNVFRHKDYDNVLVVVQEADGELGTKTPRFNNGFDSLKSAAGSDLMRAKITAFDAGVDAAQAYNEFLGRLNNLNSDIPNETSSDSNAETFQKGFVWSDQTVFIFVFDETNNEVQVMEQFNYSDGFSSTDSIITDNLKFVLDAMLSETPLKFEFQGAAGKYQNKLRMKRFPRNSKLSLKKVSRNTIAVAQGKSVSQVDADRLTYSLAASNERKTICKHRMFKAASNWCAGHAAAASGDYATYLNEKAVDFTNMAAALPAHGVTFEGLALSDFVDPSQVLWSLSGDDLFGITTENSRVVNRFHYMSDRTVSIADVATASDRSFIPTYELNYSVATAQTSANTAQSTADFTLNRANAELLARLNSMLTLEQKQEILNKKHAIYRVGYQNRPQGINQEEIDAQDLFMTSLKQKAKDDLGVDIDMYVNYQKDSEGNPILDEEVKVAFVFGFPDLATHNKVIAFESNADATDTSTFFHKVTDNSGLSPTEIDLWMFITDDSATNTQAGLSENWVYDPSAAAGSLKSIMSAGNVWDGFTGRTSLSWWDLVTVSFNNANNLHIGRFSELRAQIGSSVISEANGVFTLTPATRLNIGVGFGPDSAEALAVNMIDVELAIVSQGQIRARLYNAGATMTGDLDAGTIDANIMFSAYALGFSAASQLPANGLATAYTGMTAAQTTSYYLSEQGKLDYEDMYADSSYVGFPTCQVGPEAFGWSKTQITNLAEMRAQTAIRTPGGYLATISQNVYRDGVSGPDNVFPDNPPTTVGGIVAGTYDMWEWNSAGVDATLVETYGPEGSTIKDGATYPYHYPNGFHQVTALTDLVFTRTKLAEFNDQEIQWIREACARTAVRFQGARDAIVSRNLKHITDSTDGWSGITILDTPTDIRDAFILEAKSVLDNLDWTSNPEDGVKFNQMLANLLAYANPGPSVDDIVADIQSRYSTTEALDNRVRAMGDITFFVGMNAWAFPELETDLATVAGATAGVPDANGNTWTSEQITQAVNLATYYATVGPLLNLNVVAWDSTIHWLAHPPGVGPHDLSYLTVGNSFFKFGTVAEFDAAWYGDYQTVGKPLRTGALAQPYVDAGAIGAFRAPVFRGEKGRLDYTPLLYGVKALVMNFTVTDQNAYNTWRNDLPEDMSDDMFILVDTSFRREARVAEGGLWNTAGRVMVLEVSSETEGTTFFADHPPAGATVNVAYVITDWV